MKIQCPSHQNAIRFPMLLTLVLVFVASAGAATLTVGNGTGPCTIPLFSTIQLAINASHPGDTINVCPGTYHESITIDQTHANLTVHGVTVGNQNQPVLMPLTAPPFSIVFVQRAKNVTISGLTLDASGISCQTMGVFFDQSSGTINGMSMDCVGIEVATPNPAPLHVDVSNNNVHHNGIGILNSSMPFAANALDVSVTGNAISLGTANGLTSGPPLDSSGITFYRATGEISGNVVTGGPCVGPNNCVRGFYYPYPANIVVTATAPVKVKNNSVFANLAGIEIFGDSCEIQGNTISDSYSAGIFTLGNKNKLSGNTIFHTGLYGILIDGGANNFLDNSVNDSPNGLALSGDDGNVGPEQYKTFIIRLKKKYSNIDTLLVFPGPQSP